MWHEKDDADVAGRARIPTELKLLGVLRILGRSTCFDGIFELSIDVLKKFIYFFFASV